LSYSLNLNFYNQYLDKWKRIVAANRKGEGANPKVARVKRKIFILFREGGKSVFLTQKISLNHDEWGVQKLVKMLFQYRKLLQLNNLMES